MASRTELALRALIAAIEAKSAALPTVLPQPKAQRGHRQPLCQLDGSTGGYLNVLDGVAVRKGRTARR